jgi:mycothiol system anti-sigma-R factor
MAEVEPHDHDGPHDPERGDHTGHDHGGNCDEALAELYVFLDGELTDQKRTAIREHLDDCSPCLEVYDFEAELRLVIKHHCSDQVPDSLRGRVAKQLAALELDGPGPTAGSDAPR